MKTLNLLLKESNTCLWINFMIQIILKNLFIDQASHIYIVGICVILRNILCYFRIKTEVIRPPWIWKNIMTLSVAIDNLNFKAWDNGQWVFSFSQQSYFYNQTPILLWWLYILIQCSCYKKTLCTLKYPVTNMNIVEKFS